MKSKFKKVLVKILALVLVFTLTFPSQILAQSLAKKPRKIYGKETSLMGLQVKALEKEDKSVSGDKSAQNQEPTLLKSDKQREDLEKLEIEKSVSLSQTTGQISYRIAIRSKENDLEKIKAFFAINKNSKEEKLKLEKTTSLDENGNEIEIENQVKTPNILNQDKDIETLSATTENKSQEVIYYLSTQIEEKTFEKIKDNKDQIYSLDFVIKDQNEEILHQERLSFKEKEDKKNNEENPQEIILEENPEDLYQLEIIEEENQIEGTFKEANLLGDKKAEITWTDFIISPKAIENEFTNYQINLDENQDTTDSQIKVDFYQADEEGFILKKEFSQEIPFAKESELQIPQGFIAKIALTTKVKKDVNPKEFTYNNKIIKNPYYKEESKDKKTEEENKDSDEDPLPDENKEVKENSLPEKSKDQTSASPIDLNKDALINKYKSENKLNENLQAKVEEITQNIKSYNDEKINEEEFKNNLKYQAKDLDRENLKEILITLTSGLNEEKFKVAKIDLEKLLDEIYPKEEIKANTEENQNPQTKELTKENTEDKEKSEENSKKTNTATENQTNQVAEVDEPAKEDSNKEGLLGKLETLLFGKENIPTPVGQSQLNLEGKKFTVRTVFKTSNIGGPIQDYQYFKIHLDEKLTVKNPSELKDIVYNGRVIAKPTYNKDDNTITYNIEGTIPENIEVPLNIPVDYNTEKITLEEDGTFTVTNKVSGLGIKAPKDLVPQKIDKNGNPAGSIIEPGRDDVEQIIDQADYKLNLDPIGTPVVEDGVMTGMNWTIKVNADEDLKDGLGFNLNLTTVKGSGLGEIQKFKVNGQELNITSNGALTKNPIDGKLGITSSVHYKPEQAGNEAIYTFYTPVVNRQGSYMVDISIYNANKTLKKGAVRSINDNGFSQEAIRDFTPTRSGINNRTTILGEFKSNNNATWTITDAVSSKDEINGLPLETRTLEGNQTIASGQSAVYGLNDQGQMVQIGTTKNINQIPAKESDPQGKQEVGNIAVYEFNTNLTEKQNDPNKYSISGVSISRFKDLPIDQHWNLPQGYEKMPAQDIKVVSKSGEELGKTTVKEGDGKQRIITVPNVKYWNINEKGEASFIDHKINQTFPTKNVTIGTKEYKYNENTSYYNYNDKNHFILNSLMEVDNKKPATFKIVKVDSKTGKKLSGASFHLLGTGVSVVTDANGEATFTNIPPGTYTFQETKAPKGYKLDGENKTITISDNGEVIVSGRNVDFSQAAGKTEVVEHNKYPNWPDYMNAMHYGKIDANGNVEFYLYLKPIAPRQGGQTDRNTRLDISIPGVNITDVTAYDVSPGNRANVKSAMVGQTAGTLNLGSNVIGANHSKVITGTTNKLDSYTGRTGYQIYFPKERFEGDWGFLVKVKANIGQNNSASLYYDWLTNEDTASQANIQKVVSLSKNPSGADDKPTITIKNTPFEKKAIEIFKFANTFTNGKRDRLSGAEFVLKDSEGNTIKNAFTDENGKASFGEYPEGKYTIEEVKAPDGYEKNGVYFEVEVNESQEVKYTARFENSSATPQPGQDYFIDKGEEIGNPSKNIVTSVNQWLDYNEGQSYSRGERPKVWEAYRYESLKYHADITLSSSGRGERFEIQFDPNLDFTQYFNGFPKLKINGKEVADPYFNYETNLLTYVFNDKTAGGPATATIDLIGMIPSKYYAKNTGTYPFTITVQPNQTGITGQKLDKNIEAFFDSYDSGNNEPVQNYYFREIYEENGQYYVDVISYYNVIGDRNPYKKVNPKTLAYNWITTKFQGGNIANWVGEGTEPRQVLDRVKIYRTEANVRSINNDFLVNDYMPLSMGFRAEQEPNIYRPVFNASVDPTKNATISQNGITLVYDKGQINPNGKLIDNRNQPLKINMPSINNGEGYVIEQRFKIPDIDAFNNKWRAFVMNNGNLKSAFASGANKSFATGDQTGGETPKYYKEDVGVINKKYTPGQFKIIKSNQSDNSKLAGATFELTDANNNTIYRTSGKNGELSFTNLAPGSYTLKETRAPKDFIKSEKRWTVNVHADGTVRITQIGILGSDESYFGNNENIIIMPVSNKPSGAEFRVYKKDSDGKALEGAKFKITRQGETNSTEVTSNPKGVVEFKDLTQGTYIIEESQEPTGYNKLDKKWVLVIDKDGNKKVYNYRGSSETTTTLNSILEKEGVNWVDVAGRSLDGWNLYDNRYTGWTGNNVDPFKMGTRIVGINRKEKYVIQRYVINPESASIGATTATIHREKPEYPNMDWYKGGETYQVYKLNKPVTGVISDIRLAEYGATDITSGVKKDVDNTHSGQPQRLKLTLPATDKPLVVDIKVPYKEESGGVGTGMDWTENGTTYWKSDYYERASVIKEASPVVSTDGNIIGSYVGEGSLDVTNEFKTFDFKLKKVKDNDNTKAIEGAKFKLTGPGEGGEAREITTGSEGIISFDKLRPGIYKLEEIEPAPGYEKSNVDWTVRIDITGNKYIKVNNPDNLTINTNLIEPNANNSPNPAPIRTLAYSPLLKNNGEALANSNIFERRSLKSVKEFNIGERLTLANQGLEISDESIPTALKAPSDWQKVDPNASEGRKQGSQTKSLARTEITDINKVDHRFKQRFEFYESQYGARKREIQIHREPEKYALLKSDTNIKVFQVNKGKTIDITSKIEFKESKTTPKRLIAEVAATFGGTIIVELETSYDPNYGIGLGSNYDSNKGNYGDENKAWVADSYDKEASINKNLVSSYNLSITNGANGSVTASKTTDLKQGENVTLTISPSDGYELEKLTVAGVDVTNSVKNGHYSFTMPASNVAVKATFKAKLYSVWTQSVDHGSITASPNTNLKAGDKVTITAKPDPGYKLEKITYNDNNGQEQTISLPAAGNIIFTMPAYSVTLTAHFKDARPSYNVEVTQPQTGGSISANPTSAKEGDIVSLSASPSEGYLFDKFVVKDANNKPITVDQNNQFTMPSSKVTVTATFKEKPKNVYPITVEPTKNGSIGVAASATNGDTVTVSVNPNEYYELESLTYNGTSITKDDQGNYKFTMPEAAVNIKASFRVKEMSGKQEGEIEIPSEGELIKITNKQTGLDLKIFKRDSNSRPLEGGKFTLKKTKEDYTTEDTTFTKIAGISGKDGKLVFKDGEGNEKTLALQPGYYVLEETESPSGYKKAQAPWKIHVYEDTTTNQLKAEYQGPDETPNSFVSSDKALDGYDPNTQEQSPIKTTNSGIKYAARMTHINTEGKTYIQRIYIDTRAYNKPVNVQINPVEKREEIDTPGQPPVTTKPGVKTAYRSTYEIKGLAENPDKAKLNDIFRNYTIANDDVSVVNTARWRPFDWGFDEDQLNLDPGVYYIDVEGFYDDNITKEDIGKIEMKVDFMTPRYFWQADGFNQDNTQHFKLGGSYQAGAETFGSVYEEDTYVNGVLHKKGTPTPWGAQKPNGQKYPNWLSKEFTDQYDRNWKYGIVAVPAGSQDQKIDSVTTSISIKPLYTSTKTTQVGPEGMDIVNDEETYNITFSKHGRDDKNEDVNSEAVTKRRLEGAVFKLQEFVINGYKDVEGSTISSAFNGYFGFRGLKPGRYRLIEVKAPEGYKPIDGPLLHFTVETIKTNSGKIVDPESGEVVDIKTINVKFSENDEKAYKLSDLNMVNPDNSNQIIKVSGVDSKKISIKESQIVNPTTNAIVNLNDLIIVTANGHGYPIKQIKIIDGSSGYISLEYDKANGVYQYVPEKSTSEKDGKLVDFVTSATAKNMGKIINEKPGKGEITVKKVNQKGDAIKATNQLPGAKFKLTNKETGRHEEKTVGADGTLKFTGLNIGHYRLEEVKSPDGYINNKQVWNFTVGGEDLDPYANDAPQRRKDVSSSITLSESKLSVLNPDSKKEGLLSDNQKEMHPHFGEVFEFANKYTIDSNLKINPGDYFVLKLSDNIDLHGIMETDISNLDIIADGVGTIAKADYNRKEGKITYTFTNYADTYSLVEFSNKLKAYINLNKVPKAGEQSIERGVVGHEMIKDDINVVYDSMTARELYQATDGNWYEMTQNHLNLGSKIIKFNPDTGEFVHYYYVNRDRSNTPRSTFYYSSDQNIENLNIDYYYLDGNANLDELMPLSFGVNEDDPRLPAPVQIRSRSYLSAGEEVSIGFNNGLDKNSSYIFKVTGKIRGEDKDGYVAHGMLQFIDNPGRYVTRRDKQYFFKNDATAKANLEIQAVNPENIIKFKKVDQDGNALAGAKFQLQYKQGENWVVDKSRDKTTGEDGVFEYTMLKPGSYRVMETSAPNGYKKAEDPVAVFDVDENGRIIRKDTKIPVGGTAENTSNNEEEHGTTPIEIVNKKEHKIIFKKTGPDGENPLEGAEFKVFYKKEKTGKYSDTELKLYQNTNGDKLVLSKDETAPTGYNEVKNFTTGQDGKIDFTFYENGYYALKETKAPSGYIKPRDYVKEFAVADGEVKEKTFTDINIKKDESTENKKDLEMTFIVNGDNKELTYFPDETTSTTPKSYFELTAKNIGLDFRRTGANAPEVKIYHKKSKDDEDWTEVDSGILGSNGSNILFSFHGLLKKIKDPESTDPIKSTDSFRIVVRAKLTTQPDNTTGKLTGTTITQTLKLPKGNDGADIDQVRTISIESIEKSVEAGTYENIKYTKKTEGGKEIKEPDPMVIVNKQAIYPFTGGNGTLFYALCGFVVMLVGVLIYAFYQRNKRTLRLKA